MNDIKKDFFNEMCADEFPNAGTLYVHWQWFVYQFTYFFNKNIITTIMLVRAKELGEPCKYAYVKKGKVYNCQCNECF